MFLIGNVFNIAKKRLKNELLKYICTQTTRVQRMSAELNLSNFLLHLL